MNFPPEQLQRLMALLEDKGRAGTWYWLVGSTELIWSAGLYRILGVNPSTPATFDLYTSLVHPDDRLDFGNPARLVEDGALAYRQFRVIRADGVQRVVRSFGVQVHTPEGAPLQMIGAAFDVTDSWRGTSALRKQSGLFDALQELLDIHLWQTEADGSVSDATEWQQPPVPESLSPADWRRLNIVHPDDRPLIAEAWRQALADQRHYRADYRVRTHGSIVKVASRGMAIRGPTGLIEGWVGVTAPAVNSPSLDLEAEATLTPDLIRAARGLLDWTLSDLASKSRLSVSTIRRAEQTKDRPTKIDSISLIRQTFEREGLKFIRSGRYLGVMHAVGKD